MALLRERATLGSDSLAFAFPPRFPPQAERVVRGLTQPSWFTRVDGAPRVRLLVALSIDTAPRPEGSPRRPGYAWWYAGATYLLPEVTDGHTCVSLMPVSRREARIIDSTGTLGADALATVRRHAIGPCAYYGAFGLPGPGVRDWLVRQEFSPLRDIGWTDDPLAKPPMPMRRSNVSWWNARVMDLVACAAEDRARCRSLLWGQPDPNARGLQFADFEVPGVMVGWYGASTYLADMIAHYGRERFERFWTSDAPLEQAFEQAMGEPIEQYTMKWAQANVGVPDVGTPTRAVPALLAVAASLVVVGGAAALTRLRQVT